MYKIYSRRGSQLTSVVPASIGKVHNWQRWAPYAAVAWSLIYAALGVYWMVMGRGFPYASETVSNVFGPVIARFGAGFAWTNVILAGIPAAALGAAMLRGVRSRSFRFLFITAGALFAGVLLLLMTDITPLVLLGYTPYGIVGLLTGAEIGRAYLEALTQWTNVHQLLCLIGGFLWLAATVCFGRRSGEACLYCGRRDGSDGWKSPDRATNWGRIAAYLATVVPVFYAVTRYAYALGIPLGISKEFLRIGQESGMWTSGLFLATFGLVGAVLTLGLVQRWDEVFPRWMIGLAGRHVPIGLALVPASLVSVLLIVGGMAMWSGLAQMVAETVAGGAEHMGIIAAAPTALFPFWGMALAVAALGYYYRRRGSCRVCGRGTSGKVEKPLSRIQGR
jgi:hypothetical protein